MGNPNKLHGKFTFGKQYKVNCKVCNKELIRTPSHFNGKKVFYCSYACQYKRGSALYRNCPNCNIRYATARSSDKKYCSKECYTNYFRKEFTCAFCKVKFVQKQCFDRGKKNYCSWEHKRLSMTNPLTAPYKNLTRKGAWKTWRRRVLKRDGYCCLNCGATEKLEADHIEPVAKLILEDRISEIFEVSNGRTLCSPCHKLTPTYGSKTRELLKELFIQKGGTQSHTQLSVGQPEINSMVS